MFEFSVGTCLQVPRFLMILPCAQLFSCLTADSRSLFTCFFCSAVEACCRAVRTFLTSRISFCAVRYQPLLFSELQLERCFTKSSCLNATIWTNELKSERLEL